MFGNHVFVWTVEGMLTALTLGVFLSIIVGCVAWAFFDHFVRTPYRMWKHRRGVQKRSKT